MAYIYSDDEVMTMGKVRLRTCLVACVVVVLALGAASPVAAHPGAGGNVHSFDLTGTIRVVDDDWGSPDDIKVFTFTGFADLTSPTTPPGSFRLARLSRSSFCVDEVRVELSVGLRVEDTGAGNYYVSATLFEGTSCGTTDRDGFDLWGIFHLPVDTCQFQQFIVRNEDEGGDFATFTIEIEQDHQILMQWC